MFLKRFLPRTLMARAILIIVAPVVLLLAVTTTVFYERHWDAVTRRLSLGVAGEIALTIEQLEGLTQSRQIDQFLRSARNQLLLDFRFRDGALLPTVPPPVFFGDGILSRTLNKAMSERLDQAYRVDTSDGDLVMIQVQLREGVLDVRVPRERLTSSTTSVFMLWLVGTSLILLLIAILFLRNQIRPIRALANVADAFGKGREVPDFKPWGAIEVRQAAAAFDTMRKRIRRFVAQRTEMLAGVSHDLRTPLTRMRLQLAMLPESQETANLRSDVDEMQAMVEGYLAFARNQDTEAAVETDLPLLLEQVVANARRQGAKIALSSDRHLLVPLHPNAFLRCMTNLVDNARRYAQHVAVSAKRVGNMIEIAVDDDGPGIPADKHEEVFLPFRRLEQSRNPQTGGLGLGLAIARDVVRSHGGEISLGVAPLGGLRALVRIPV